MDCKHCKYSAAVILSNGDFYTVVDLRHKNKEANVYAHNTTTDKSNSSNAEMTNTAVKQAVNL